MSQNLPEFPNLEHLRKQAKALLRELKQQNSDAKLTDAQYAVARKYGFASWAKLKTHVEALPQPRRGGAGGCGAHDVASQSGDSNPGLFRRFTMRARRVIFFARYFAGRHGATQIEPVYLLRGLVQEDGGRLKRLLKNPPVLENFPVDIGQHPFVAEDILRNTPIPLGTDSKRILELARDEADRLRDSNIATGHVWLACLREENLQALSVLHRLFKDSGISMEQARRTIEGDLPEV